MRLRVWVCILGSLNVFNASLYLVHMLLLLSHFFFWFKFISSLICDLSYNWRMTPFITYIMCIMRYTHDINSSSESNWKHFAHKKMSQLNIFNNNNDHQNAQLYIDFMRRILEFEYAPTSHMQTSKQTNKSTEYVSNRSTQRFVCL